MSYGHVFLRTVVPMQFFFECYGDIRDLYVLPHSFPTRRSSDLAATAGAPGARHDRLARWVDPAELSDAADEHETRRQRDAGGARAEDRKSTRLNSSH